MIETQLRQQLLNAYIRIELQQRYLMSSGLTLKQALESIDSATDVIAKMRTEVSQMKQELFDAKINIPKEIDNRMQSRLTLFDNARDSAIRAMQKMVKT